MKLLESIQQWDIEDKTEKFFFMVTEEELPCVLDSLKGLYEIKVERRQMIYNTICSIEISRPTLPVQIIW